MSELEVDEKRMKAIQSMVEMAEDAKGQGQSDMAAGFFDEAARLVDAHAENAATDMAGEMLRSQAADYRAQARALKEGKVAAPGSGSASPSATAASGAWEVTWTRGGAEGEPRTAPASAGAPWEPFAVSEQQGGVVFGWRRPVA